MKKIVVYTDGGARGNPGPSGIGVYIVDSTGKVVKEVSTFLGHGTNNVAEYTAVIVALETLRRLYKKEVEQMQFEIRVDSELVVRQLEGVYRVKDSTLKVLHTKVGALRLHFPHIVFTQADRLANDAMDRGVVKNR
jgi:ribonuclease HI